MKTIIISRGSLCVLILLLITGNAQACYYEGDPVLTSSGYDIPKTSSDNDCYYGGDPVMESSGKYDSPEKLAGGSYYYYADMQETAAIASDSQDTVEFSAFEHEAETPASQKTEILTGSRVTVDDYSEQNWTPVDWYEVY